VTATQAESRAAAVTVIGYAVRESVRRKVLTVVLILTVAFLVLYALGVHFAFKDTEGFSGLDVINTKAFTGATLLGLAMFATLFLGAVVAVFLTLGVVRGDAETGLLQPLVVRPLGRTTMLLARFAGAAAFAAAYGLVVFLCATLITGAIGGWWPDHILAPGLGLAAGLVIVAALSLLASVFLSSTAQGIAVLMVFGAGLTAGLLGEIADAINSDSLTEIAKVASWVLPFEALYQGGLHALTSNTTGLTGTAISLGPFGGPRGAGIGLVLWALVYLAGTVAIACLWFGRRDL
jgi:ABC-type transport system involved in multi-copper enzyme maturation permease subunit